MSANCGASEAETKQNTANVGDPGAVLGGSRGVMGGGILGAFRRSWGVAGMGSGCV